MTMPQNASHVRLESIRAHGTTLVGIAGKAHIRRKVAVHAAIAHLASTVQQTTLHAYNVQQGDLHAGKEWGLVIHVDLSLAKIRLLATAASRAATCSVMRPKVVNSASLVDMLKAMAI